METLGTTGQQLLPHTEVNITVCSCYHAWHLSAFACVCAFPESRSAHTGGDVYTEILCLFLYVHRHEHIHLVQG